MEDAVLASFLREDGLHAVVLTLSLNDVLTVLRQGKNGSLTAVARNDKPHENEFMVLIAFGKSFEGANQLIWNWSHNMVEPNAGTLMGFLPDYADVRSL